MGGCGPPAVGSLRRRGRACHRRAGPCHRAPFRSSVSPGPSLSHEPWTYIASSFPLRDRDTGAPPFRNLRLWNRNTGFGSCSGRSASSASSASLANSVVPLSAACSVRGGPSRGDSEVAARLPVGAAPTQPTSPSRPRPPPDACFSVNTHLFMYSRLCPFSFSRHCCFCRHSSPGMYYVADT